MKYNVVVATHHKTGTVWMDGVFKAVAADLGVRFVDYHAETGKLNELLRERFVLFNSSSDFAAQPELLKRQDVRVLHVIRDPRDILISAMHYHRHAGEDWLHQPAPRFGGTSYQRALLSRSKFNQYVFEMENSTGSTLRDVRRWQYGRPNCFEARYEDLRQDSGLVRWRNILALLGLDKRQRESAAQRIWQNSLFGSAPRLGNSHIRSGAVAQWKREFTVRLGYAFLERFPCLLQLLNYEPDTRWLLELPRTESLGLITEMCNALGSRWELLSELARSAASL
jgi:hypothetical protein